MSEFENLNEIQEPLPVIIPPVPQIQPPVAPPAPPKPKKNRLRLLFVTLALCFSLLGGALGAGAVLLMQDSESGDNSTVVMNTSTDSSTKDSNDSTAEDSTTILEGNREDNVIDITQIDTSKLLTAAEVYAANVNSTVGITTSITTNYWGYQSTSAASGSGFIISADGYILTNHHVIEDSTGITVTMYNGDDYDAKLIGYDASNDIAVLKIEAENLVPVVLGDSDKLNVGESVVAIGNPLGELTFSITAGIVSAKDREVTFSNGLTMDLIQTDCAINSGNSGGALFNLYGEVIGVTNAKYSSSGSQASIDNIGFAIPINSIRAIVESIIEKGYVAKPYLGVSVTDIGDEYAIYGLPVGAAIKVINEDSPAEKSGLQLGDIVTKAGNQEITCGDDLVKAVAASTPGDQMVLTVYRSGTTLEITVEIGEQIQENNQQQQQQPSYRPW